MALDEYNVEVDEVDQHHVVLVIRALHVIVLGRTLCEARQLATAAIASRDQAGGEPESRPAAGSTAVVTDPRDAPQAA